MLWNNEIFLTYNKYILNIYSKIISKWIIGTLFIYIIFLIYIF
jgi:hypothetical protein